MQIKTALAEIRSRPPTLPPLPSVLKTVAAAQAIPALSIKVDTRPPPDLNEIAARVISSFRRGENPDRRDVNQAPWCIWDGSHPLTREADILASYLTHVRTARRKSTFKRLASVYVVRFDPKEAERPDSALHRVAATLKSVSAEVTGPLSAASAHLNLFDPRKAPSSIAKMALSRGSSPSRVLSDFGIHNLGAEAGLAEAAFLAGLTWLMTDSSLTPDSRLECIQSWGTRPDGSVIFDQHRGAYVDALVIPLDNVRLSHEVMDRYLKFLMTRFGDPRLRPARWQPMRSAPIVRRWLTSLSLRQFLDVVDQGAYDFQWRYRRAFWEAVHRRGLIDDAWVIFDEYGDFAAKRLFDVRAPYGRWTAGGRKQIERGHAVLLLRIGGGIVAEWSHNGRCNIWHDANDPTAPSLGRLKYNSDEVRVSRESTSDFRISKITHAGSEGYNWQSKVANEIFALTSIRLMESEYRV